MKNTINYFYNLQPKNIHQYEKQLKFNYNNNNYVFLPYYRKEEELKDLQKLATFLFSKGVYCHQFVPNINSSIITLVNNIPYVLLVVYVNDNRTILFDDLIWFSNVSITSNIDSLKRDNWFSLWIEKIDYFEYQVSQFGKTFPLLRESFSYFVGMAETGISFLKNINTNYEKTFALSHGRVKNDNTLFDLYNPLTFIIDNKTRDICEYFKECFFKGIDKTNDLFNYISQNNLTSIDCLLLYARMLFPTFYFDIYELIVQGSLPEKEILPIINKIDDYELFLNQFHNYLKQYIQIPNIEWINK
ncbi:MAG: hypothetical protein PHW32_00545 [Bacilli bacterium]|nr:hypothetical protein [Bacilli bacterium]MDD4282218.1 hypothetical protein [Bacilli bacterium]MDD4718217.1 hypothetical protein [Bacilli bacterium]